MSQPKVICGDCLEVVPTLGLFDLIVVDSPYNYNEPYLNHNDRMSSTDFMEWLEDRLRVIVKSLKETGSFWIFAPDEWVSEVDVFLKLIGLIRRSWVVWHYTFGVANQKNFSRSHTHILYYVKGPNFFFDPPRVPSARSAIYKDKRANPKGKVADNTWVLHKKEMEDYFRPDEDTWLINRVCGTYKERRPISPNQIPEAALERIIQCSSRPGDRVMDPFMGSGSTGLVCQRSGREFVGVDISPELVRAFEAIRVGSTL